MSNEFEANERVQKPEALESKANESQSLNLLDITAKNEAVGHHDYFPYPYPYPVPRPTPSSHVGGTQIEVHDGKIVVHGN